MKTSSLDTHLQIERLQIELLRKASVFQHLQIVNSLIKTVRQLSWLGLCERYSHETEDLLIRRFIWLLYGDESLGERVIKKKTNEAT